MSSVTQDTALSPSAQQPPTAATPPRRPPPTRQEIPADPSLALSWIQARTLELYSTDRISQRQQDPPPLLDRAAYLDMYNTVHNYGVVVMKYDTEAGQKLYDFLEQKIADYCRAVRFHLQQSTSSPSSETQSETQFLRTYLEQWNFYENLGKVGTNVFRTFDRHWVKRETDERRSTRERWWKEESVRRRERLGRRDEEMPGLVWSIGELHARGWRREVLGLRGDGDGDRDGEEKEADEGRVMVGEIVRRALLKEEGEEMQENQEVGESCRKVGVGLRDGKLVVLLVEAAARTIAS